MATTDARPIPQKNVAYRVTFPIFDNDGDLVTGASALDSEVSKDAGTFADCTNEATEIATSSGIYYLDLTATEMNADTVAIIVKTTTTDAKTTPIILYPEEAGDIRVNVTQISDDGTAADNCELFFDGTGYAGGTTKLGVDAVSISGDTTAADNLELDYDGTGYAKANSTVGTVTTLTNLPAITSNWLTAAGIAASALDGKGDWNVGKTGYSLTQAFPTNFADLSITATSGLVTLAAVTHTGAVIPTVTTLTGHTAQTGDSFARLGAPAGASVSADIAAVKLDSAAILVDTGTTLDTKLNDIQGATFNTSTDSLEAIRDRGDSAWTTGAGGSDRLLMVDTTIATLSTQTSFTLTAGSADDDAYNNCTIIVEDVSTSTQKAVGMVLDYTGSTKTVTLKEALAFTIATTDKVYILAENSLKSTVANRQLDVTATGAAGIDWGNVENPTTVVDLSGTDIQLCDTVTSNSDMRGTDSAALASDYTSTRATYLDNINGHVAQSGDSFARLGVPVTSDISGDIAAVKAETANILVDTAEIGVAGAGLTDITINAASVDLIWDEATSGHATPGTTGKALTDAGSAGDPWATALPGAYGAGTAGKIVGDNINAPIATVDTVVDAIKAVTDNLPDSGALNDLATILVDTADMQPKLGTPAADISADIAAVKVDSAAILVDTADMQPKLGTPAADLSADIAAMKVDTAAILVDTADMQPKLGTPSTDLSADIAAIMTTQMTESYAADGVAPTPAQSLFLIQQHLTEFAIVGTTWTTKKLDGSTTVGTFTLDDATTPTSMTRAT